MVWKVTYRHLLIVSYFAVWKTWQWLYFFFRCHSLRRRILVDSLSGYRRRRRTWSHQQAMRMSIWHHQPMWLRRRHHQSVRMRSWHRQARITRRRVVARHRQVWRWNESRISSLSHLLSVINWNLYSLCLMPWTHREVNLWVTGEAERQIVLILVPMFPEELLVITAIS